MSTKPPAAGSTIPEPTPPKCPHCKEDMPTVDGYPYTLGNFIILSVACTKCKMLLHMGIMPVAKLQQLEEGPGGPRIQIPS
jgi:hypothetical protein